jgi:RNA polymerase-interacting CarD/CdnL/TRCF family regulator
MTMECERIFSKGDWIVHSYYGIGSIQSVERKHINDATREYYRVQAQNSIFWVPTDTDELCRVRPLVSDSELKEALEALSDSPCEIGSNHKQRQALIRKAKEDGSLTAVCRIVRDLNAQHRRKPLNDNEKRVMEAMQNHLMREWALCTGLNQEDIRQELNERLKHGRENASVST